MKARTHSSYAAALNSQSAWCLTGIARITMREMFPVARAEREINIPGPARTLSSCRRSPRPLRLSLNLGSPCLLQPTHLQPSFNFASFSSKVSQISGHSFFSFVAPSCFTKSGQKGPLESQNI